MGDGQEHRYSVDFEWEENKRGRAASGVLPPLTIGAAPKFGGDGHLLNPEVLILSALAACYALTFTVLADKTRLVVRLIRVSVEGILTQSEDRGWSFTRFLVRPEVEVSAEDQLRAGTLLEKAEKYCLIGRSLRGRISIEPAYRRVAKIFQNENKQVES